jgi:hypothetical protein
MPTITHSLVIRAGRAALFELTQDYGRRLRWDPFLKEARLLGGAPRVEVGVRAWCVAWHGLGMETEYVTVSAPAVVAAKMTRGPAVLAAFAGSWRFDEAGPAAMRVTFRHHFKARPRWLRWLLEPGLAAVFARDIRLRLAALTRTVEGSAPGGGRSAPVSAAAAGRRGHAFCSKVRERRSPLSRIAEWPYNR